MAKGGWLQAGMVGALTFVLGFTAGGAPLYDATLVALGRRALRGCSSPIARPAGKLFVRKNESWQEHATTLRDDRENITEGSKRFALQCRSDGRPL